MGGALAQATTAPGYATLAAGDAALTLLPSLGGRVGDVSLGERYACTMFVELPRTEMVIAIEEGAVPLEMRVHGRALLHAGIWINRGVLAPAERKAPMIRWRRPRTYSTLTMRPCVGGPESLADALGAWATARRIEPGATARRTKTWRAGAPT